VAGAVGRDSEAAPGRAGLAASRPAAVNSGHLLLLKVASKRLIAYMRL
jgi:hypothetical protein